MSHPHRLTPRRPWAPLTDLQWHALAPYVVPRAQGRRVADLRARMDAVFQLACRGHGVPWREALALSGTPGTVARFFRRLTHRGLWHRLLSHLAGDVLAPTHPLRQIEWFVCAAARRAARLGGLRLLFLIRALGLHSALAAPSWLLPDRFLSVLVRHLPIWPAHLNPLGPRKRGMRAALSRWLGTLKRLHRMAGGRARIPRSLRLAW